MQTEGKFNSFLLIIAAYLSILSEKCRFLKCRPRFSPNKRLGSNIGLAGFAFKFLRNYLLVQFKYQNKTKNNCGLSWCFRAVNVPITNSWQYSIIKLTNGRLNMDMFSKIPDLGIPNIYAKILGISKISGIGFFRGMEYSDKKPPLGLTENGAHGKTITATGL